MDEIRDELAELKSGLKTVSDKQTVYDDENVGSRLDELDQYGRRNMLRLSGVPESREDEPTLNVVTNLIKDKLGIEILRSDLDRVHRLGPYDKNAKTARSIVVKFTHYAPRAAIFASRKKFGDSGIFVNDHLTSIRARLMFVARLYKKKDLILNVWSSEGRILVRTKNNATIAITHPDDLLHFDPNGLLSIPDKKGKPAVAAAPAVPAVAPAAAPVAASVDPWTVFFFYLVSPNPPVIQHHADIIYIASLWILHDLYFLHMLRHVSLVLNCYLTH